MKSLIACSFMLIVITAAIPTHAADEPAAEAQKALAGKFALDFYTWYEQEGKKDHDVALDAYAIQVKPNWFSAALVKGLKEDEEASARSPDEVVGLDFDPFTNSQEDCGPYKIGKVIISDDGYRVEMFGQCPPVKPGQPDVIAVVEPHGKSWVFMNFVYPGNGDLFSVLRDLKKERANPPK